MSTGEEKTAANAAGRLELDDLGYMFLKRPFSIDRITEPGVGDVDVSEIHAKPFDTLKSTAYESLHSNCGIGVVLWGVAGVGKSHVLARLADWAKKEGPCCMMLQNINACAAQLVDSMRKSVISQLTNGKRDHYASTRLYQMAEKAVRRRKATGETNGAAPFMRFVDSATARHPTDTHQDRKIYQVLWKFLASAQKMENCGVDDGGARLAVQWLFGDRLEADELARLGLNDKPANEESAVPDDYPATRLLVSLGEIARGCGQPFIICLDQIEVLDDEQIHRLSKFLHVLLDRAKNLLLITSGVQETLLQFVEHKAISEAAWSRIRQRPPITLPTIDKDQARKLLQVRMEQFVESVRSLPEVWRELQRDGLFPLGTAWFADRFKDCIDIRPRKVVNLARERWDEQEQRISKLGVGKWLNSWMEFDGSKPPPPRLETLIDEKVARRIDEQCGCRKVDPSTLSPDGHNFAGLTEQLLRPCLRRDGYAIESVEQPKPKAGCKAIYDRILTAPPETPLKSIRTGLVFVTTENATSATAYLRRVKEDKAHPERVVLISDKRRPIPLGTVGQAQLKWLSGQPWFESIVLEFDDIAMLDALRAVVGQAKAGDIELDLPDGQTHTVTESEVVDSYHRAGRYLAHPLLKTLLQKNGVTVVVPKVNYDVNLLRAFILAQLALTMGMSTVGLAQKYSQLYALQPDGLAELHKSIVQAATQMHDDGLVNAKPTEDGLFLLLK